MPTAEIAEQVLHALTPVRNVCAHHGRLWNRRFTLQLPLIKRLREQMQIDQVPDTGQRQGSQQQPSRTLYNYLLIMAHMMNHINPGSSWKGRLQSLVDTRGEQDLNAMGFPANWESLPVRGLTAPR